MKSAVTAGTARDSRNPAEVCTVEQIERVGVKHVMGRHGSRLME
ncbi:MAG: hypothetical protein QM638_00790 [Nocardioides sp.]